MGKCVRGTGAGRDLIADAVTPTLIAFALPTLLSSVLQSLSGSINAIWVGRFLGEDALAATANGNIVMFLLISFVFGFGMAATILIGQSWGRSDTDTARRTAGTAVGGFVPLALVISLLGMVFARPLLELLGTPMESLELAIAYLRVIFAAMPATLLLTLLMMAMRGTGDSTTPLLFMVLSVVLDSGLNPVLILGLGPFPELGIAGAATATATAVASWTSLAALLAWTYSRDLPLRLRGSELRYLLPNPAILKSVLTKGLPIGLQMIVISSAALSMLRLVNDLGVDTTAAYGVAQQLWTYIQTPAMALGAAVSAMVAQNIGANRWDRVEQITRVGIIAAIVVTGALVLLLTLVGQPVLALFLGNDSSALLIVEHIQLLATWGFIAFGVTLVLFGTVRANGEVVIPLLILFVAMYPVRLGFALGAQRWLDADAIWWSFPLAMVATMLMAIVLYQRGAWREQKLAPIPTRHECIAHARAAQHPGAAPSPS